MKVLRILGIVLLLLGVFFILNAGSGITGFVVFEDVGKGVSSILGIAFVVGGILLIMFEYRDYSSRRKEYFHERAVEITRHPGTDEWIANWEVPGIVKELESMDVGIRGPESHLGGHAGPNIRHINLIGRNQEGDKLSHKHIFVSDDPYDSRLTETPRRDVRTRRHHRKGSQRPYNFPSESYSSRRSAFEESSYDSKMRSSMEKKRLSKRKVRGGKYASAA